MGECGIGSRVRIPEGDVLPAKLAISVTTSPKYVHTLLEWLSFFCLFAESKLTLNFACGECGIGSRVRIPRRGFACKTRYFGSMSAEICAHRNLNGFFLPFSDAKRVFASLAAMCIRFQFTVDAHFLLVFNYKNNRFLL